MSIQPAGNMQAITNLARTIHMHTYNVHRVFHTEWTEVCRSRQRECYQTQEFATITNAPPGYVIH